MLNKNVVFDFRSKDLELGGQGAPIAPIYHQNIIESLNLNLPSCILNIGGVANITYWDGKSLIGFDTGPGNALMDDYMKISSNVYYDKDGKLASNGRPNKIIIKKFLNINFFKKPPPKSLDRNEFLNFYKEILKENLSAPDTMATLAELTVESIINSLNFLPSKIKNILITGGGYKNTHLIKSLIKKLDVNFIEESDTNFNFDYVEAELIAFLSARTYYNLPFTFPTTTGISKASSGGQIFSCL
jgi:anhydro-N-acetylmuramic acid kinase